MNILKGLLAFILALMLTVTSAFAFGSYGMGKAISEEAVHEAIVETDAVGVLTDNIIAHNTINLGGIYGEPMKAILKSDAMTAFFTEYTSRCLESQIYGEEMEEIGADDLNAAFSQGMDECQENGSITMSGGERKLFDEALNLAMPNLTKGVNYVLSQMELNQFVDEETAEQIEAAQTFMSDEFRYGAIGLSIIICLLLILIYWRSKMGFIWCAVIVLIIAAFAEIMSIMLDQTVSASGSSMVLSRQMMFIMISYGLKSVVRIGAIIGGALFVACPIFKIAFRRRRW